MSSTPSKQYLPKLIISHDVVLTVDIGMSVIYHGGHVNCDIDNKIQMSEALDLLQDLMKGTYSLYCHPIIAY